MPKPDAADWSNGHVNSTETSVEVDHPTDGHTPSIEEGDMPRRRARLHLLLLCVLCVFAAGLSCYFSRRSGPIGGGWNSTTTDGTSEITVQSS